MKIKKVAELLRFCSKEGRTIIMVTHGQNMADYAGRIVHISDGMVTE